MTHIYLSLAGKGLSSTDNHRLRVFSAVSIQCKWWSYWSDVYFGASDWQWPHKAPRIINGAHDIFLSALVTYWTFYLPETPFVTSTNTTVSTADLIFPKKNRDQRVQSGISAANKNIRLGHLWLLKHTTALFALSDHYILSREWRVIVDQLQTNYHGRPMVL